MCNFSAGPWCMDCKNAKKIEDSKLFYDYVDYLPQDSTYEFHKFNYLKDNFDFVVGYVCKHAISSKCPKGDFSC